MGSRLATRARIIVISLSALAVISAGLVTAFSLRSERPLPVHHAHLSHRATHVSLVLRLRSISPAVGAKNVPFTPTIELRFSQPLGSHSPLPVLRPAVPGSWARINPTTLAFRANGDLFPLERVSISIPGGPYGLRAVSGAELPASLATTFTVADAPVLRLQQLLAELGYLPVAFDLVTAPASGERIATESAPRLRPGRATLAALDAEPNNPSQIALQPEAGSFAWRYPNIPSQLTALWTPGRWNVVTQGAVMAFEADHGLGIDGVAGPRVWRTLLEAVAARQSTTRPYDYLIVTESLPQTLYVWSGGHVVYQSLTNTGISAAPTAIGTWPVYLRFTSTTMSGTNPDGSYYSDPGVPWVAYFNGGDAVHGFIRASYGFPQSLGCVELPPANAETVYNYDPY
ncbi:MAG TPA: L,D-transpeptidase family protein, partial [Acidimicrobiales bacterium]|nr:L,D-transpeptidase family protein [Acidimicrobiales bacterium]